MTILRTISFLIFINFCFVLDGKEYNEDNGMDNKQNYFTNRLIECKYHYGFIFPHHTSIEYSVTGHVPAFEINMLYQTTGKDIWEELFRKPRIGYGLSYFYMKDHDVFGSAYGLYGLYDIAFLRYKGFAMTYRINGGLSWLTKIWDLETNYLQTAIGTHINLYFRLSMNAKMKLTEKTEFIIDAGITHFSNGRVKNPNLGINIVTATGGLIYKFNSDDPQSVKKAEPPNLKKYNLNIFYSSGMVAVNEFQNEKYYKSTLSIHGGYNVNHKRQLGLGFDIFYDGSQKYEWTQMEDREHKNTELFQYGIVAYQDLVYRKLTLTIQFGYYMYNRFNYISVYNRYGLKYKVKNNWFTSVILKAHKTQADFIEWGIGYIL